ncbi:hypothetical protein OAK51_00880 [Alphaproteobacteria bacterium]|nr:hypothetical protein [Alphaproteobacteria bacterium]
MNESLDLRKRILKMRESSVSLKEVEPKDIKEEPRNDQDTDKSKLFKKSKLEFPKNKEVQQRKNEDIQNKLVDRNEAQFLILANKFNEAVEVILELSEKVKKLEKSAYKKENELSKQSFSSSFFNLKVFIISFLVGLFVLGIFTLPLNMSLIKLILVDFLSSI